MKLSELKPCACCHGPLLSPPAGNWYVLRQTIAIIKPQAARSVMGLSMHFGGAMGLAEMFAPDANAVAILADEPGAPKAAEIHVCFDCYVQRLGELAGLFESSQHRGDAEGGTK
jgi:hypothetical protein